VFADTRQAWEGAYPERPDVTIRIEAAGALGRPVYFEIIAPWTRPRNEESRPANTSGERVALRMRTVVTPLVTVIAALLAWHNLRSGRGDRRGAIRLSLFILGAGVTSNALATGNPSAEVSRQPITIVLTALLWLLYVALEPHLRRTWPETMIGWSRLLAGGIRDPLVGRDVLAGVLVAIGNALILGLHTWVRQWSGHPPQYPIGANNSPFDGVAASSDLLLGGRFALSRIIGSVLSIPMWSGTMFTLFLLFMLLMLLRRRLLAMASLVLGLTGVYIVSHGGWLLPNAQADHFPPTAIDIAVFALVQAAVVFVVVRFGVLTLLVASFVSQLLILLPIAVNPPVPFSSSSRMIVATVIGLAGYGWYMALAGRPMFGVLFAPAAPSRRL
jgi:serine/threonine-protein kinase